MTSDQIVFSGPGRPGKFLMLLALFFCLTAANAQPVADFTANDTEGCAGYLTVQFTSTSTGTITTYAWDFGDGATSILPGPVSHTYSTPGVYTVSLTVSNGITSDTKTRTNYIIVHANPTASFTVSPDTVCEGNPVTFTNTSVPGDGALSQCGWSFNDGTPPASSCSTIVHIFNNGTNSLQSYFPNLLVLDVNGCNSTTNGAVHILPAPEAIFTISGSGNCTTPASIVFNNSSLNANGVFFWDFGDTASGTFNTSPIAQPSHLYQNPGIYTVLLTAGVAGCSDTDTGYVVLANPQAAITANDTNICIGDTVFFASSGTPGTCQWNFGDPASGASNISFQTSPYHAYQSPGTYTVTLTLNAGGCVDIATRTVIVHSPVPVTLSANQQLGCQTPFTVDFTDTTPGAAQWTWIFYDPSSGAQNVSSVQDPSHTYNSYGNFDLSLLVVDSNGCRSYVFYDDYVSILAPSVGFSLQDSGCVGDTFDFTANVISPNDTSIVSYVWDFGDGTGTQTGTTPTFQHAYTAPGFYDVSLTITTATGCTASRTYTAFIRVGVPPSADFTFSDDTICFQQGVQFTDLSPQPPVITGWLWNFGDGSSSMVQNPFHLYDLDTSGTVDPFDITLIVYNNGCGDTLTFTDSVAVLGPFPLFYVNYNCANPLSVEFVNQSGGATDYLWTFGDGTTDTVTNPVHVYPNRGGYMANLTASNSDNGCVTNYQLFIQVTIPDAVITPQYPVGCFPLHDTITGQFSANAALFQWNFGDPGSGVANTSNAVLDTHTYMVPGIYPVILTVTDIHACTNTDTFDIRVNGPTAGFYADTTTGCAPLSVTFHDNSSGFGSGIDSWYWDFGNGAFFGSYDVDSATAVYYAPGLYSVLLTVRDSNGCTDDHYIYQYIRPTRPQPVINTSDTIACRNGAFNLNVWPGQYVNPPCTYAWDFGDGTTGTGQFTSHSYPDNGRYNVSVITTDANGCSDTSDIDLTVYTTPAHFSIQAVDTCVSNNGILQAQVFVNIVSDSNQYVTGWDWDLDITTLPQGPSSVFYAYSVEPDTYTVSLVVTNQFGCVDTVTDPGAVVVPGPTGSFTFSPVSGCRPLTVNFVGSSSNSLIYTWDFDDGTVISDTNRSVISHTYLTDGTYVPSFYLGFQLPQSSSYCYVPVTDAGTVVVTAPVTVDILQDTLHLNEADIGVVNVDVTDPNNPGPHTYTWTPASNVTPQGSEGTFNVTTDGTSGWYHVTVPNGQGCSGEDSVYIYFVPCEEDLMVPNVFTPNGDGKNDGFSITFECKPDGFRFVIYNRWGRIIFETNDPDFIWDGKTKSGEYASDGVYYYTLESDAQNSHGWLELIRTTKN
jgi:gliding motility-associated-like protein